MGLDNLQIYIVVRDKNNELVFKNIFRFFKNVNIINDDFISFMNRNPNIECIVSPANCYGYMDGGYDAAISDYLGWEFQKDVQNYIKAHFYGEQIVGTSFIIDTPKNKKLIHTPTMIVPEVVLDPKICYSAMRSTLMCAIENNITSIVIPPFGVGTGEVPVDVAAKLMFKAYKQIKDAEKGIYYDFN